MNSEKDKFKLWKFQTEHKEIFQKLSGISDFKEGKEEIIREHSKNINLSEINVDNSENLKKFIEKSVMIAVNERLEIEENIVFTKEEKEIIKGLDLLTLKPLMYVANVDEETIQDPESNENFKKVKNCNFGT